MQFTGDTPATWDMLALRGAVHRRRGGRRAVATSATTSAASTATTWPTTCTRAGCSSAPSSRSTGCTPTTATGCRGTTPGPRRPAPRQFLRLREALVPYTYTLAAAGARHRRADRAADVPGLPGPATPRTPRPASTCTATTCWSRRSPRPTTRTATARRRCGSRRAPGPTTSPARAYTGPATVTITDPLSQMPVLVKAGGILPTRTDYVDNAAAAR